MEALGIAASIVGLLAAGAKLIPWLVNIADKVADAPISVKAVSSELKETIIILEAIQLYVLDRQAVTENRRALILLEHISVTLTGFVLTYSDLERHVDFVQPDKEISVFDRSKWLLKEKEILDVIRRLQNHKSSLSTMLNILQCYSLREAQNSMQLLCQLVSQTLRQDQGLVAQLERRRAAPESMAIMPVPDVPTPSAISVRDDTSMTASKQSNSSRGSKISMLSLFLGSMSPERRKGPIFEFEKDLKTSWVYKRSGFGFLSQSKTSLLSRRGSERGVAMSALSKVSWAEISNLSVFNLPVFASDIYNSEWYGPIFASGPVESPESVHRLNNELGLDVESILKEIKQSKLFLGKQIDTAEDITTRADELQPPWANSINISVNQDHGGTYSDEIMKWVSGRDPSMDFLRESQHRIHSSGQWFLGHHAYIDWLYSDSSHNRLLRIIGCPGSGKTVLSTTIIEDLRSERQHPQSLVRSALNNCTTYFYCSAANGELQFCDYFTIILSSLIKQILQQLQRLPTEVIEYYQRSLAVGRFSLSAADDPKTLLESLAREFDNLFIVIDVSYDPILYDANSSYGMIEKLFRLTRTIPNVKIILLSRRIFNLDILYSLPIIKLGDPDTSEDINRYIRDSLARLQERNAIKDFSPEIFNQISQRANGMFLWAKFMINSPSLGQANNEEEALEAVSSTPEGLVEFYNELLLQQITSPRAKEVIMLMCAAPRLLRWHELEHMLYADRQSTLVVGPLSRSTVQVGCDLFVEYLPKTDSFRFFHSSVREFFLTASNAASFQPSYFKSKFEFRIREDEAHENIAGICLNYLLDLSTTQRNRSSEPNLSLFDYASNFWGFHIIRSTYSDELSGKMHRYLSNRSRRLAWIVRQLFREPRFPLRYLIRMQTRLSAWDSRNGSINNKQKEHLNWIRDVEQVLIPTDAVSNDLASRNRRISNFEKLMVIKDLCREYTIRQSLEGETRIRDELQKRQNQYGEEDISTAWLLNSLGIIYGQQQSKVELSIEMHEKALKIQKACFGPDHSETMWSINELERIYRQLKRYNGAIKIQDSRLSENHSRRATYTIPQDSE
ncbi:hypothetical protein TWF679_011301 [Orbilia oligospora]|uniref:Nephrocystin 3-like N-terminal domain-containing protein n=1 Tax=Orbilia oligospora TaxID=2813651 RepID=A0A8H8UYA1_ORBOL|nr:hypothetical protein TWF679_011301 [Orbilia oligospora]